MDPNRRFHLTLLSAGLTISDMEAENPEIWPYHWHINDLALRLLWVVKWL